MKQKAPTDVKEPLAYRIMTFRAEDASETERTIPVTLATNQSVRTFDYERGMVDEYLLMGGVDLPKQVPLVDSHQHDSIRNILGSIRDLKVEGGELRGVAHFSDKPAGVEAFNDIRRGHLTDISVGAFRKQEKYIESGKTGEFESMRIKGPARVVTRWKPFEGSAVVIGADRHSTFGSIPALRAYLFPEDMENDAMSEALRSHFVSLGMPEDCSDIAKWAAENLTSRAQVNKEPVKAPEASKLDEEVIRKQAIEAERIRCTTIRKIAADAKLDASFADSLIADGSNVERAAIKILEKMATPEGPKIEGTVSERESFRKATLDGLCLRSGVNVERPAAGAQEFRRTRLLDIARKSLEVEGHSLRGADDRDIARMALGLGAITRASDGQAYHSTGNFANLLLDAVNKSLLPAYMEAESTYQRWVRRAPSVPDFKKIYRTRLSEIGYQPIVPENDEYKDMSLTDQKESYRIEKRGSVVSLTWETLVNDDLNAFMRVVQLQGAAMKRTVNQSVYQLLFDNPTMSDTGALFNNTAISTAGGHDNLVASDVSVSTLNTMFTKFGLKKGMNSDVLLGLRPRYIICATGIYADVWQVMNSIADPGAGGSAAGNSNTINIYGPNGSRSLEVIEEPLLDGNDADLWFAACSSNMIDTVEISFLQGEENPVFEQETAFVQDAVKYKVRQTWGVGAIDWRGLYKSTGA